jgi:FixJ family two-component response regulator
MSAMRIFVETDPEVLNMQFVQTTPRITFGAPFQSKAAAAQEREMVYIVDADARVRESLAGLLASLGRSVMTFRTAGEYLACERTDSAACLILEILLPDMNGLDLQRRLAYQNCPPIIFISGQIDVSATVRAMKAGAIEFLTKPVSPQALEAAIHVAFPQDRLRRHRDAELATLQKRYSLLTPREREVLPLVTGGLLNKEAAASLGISEVTLQVHRGQIMRKMAAPSFAELVRMAEKLGIPAITA